MTSEIVTTKLVRADIGSIIQIESKKAAGQQARALPETGNFVGLSHHHGVNNDLSCVIIKQNRENKQRSTTNLSFFFQNIEDIKIIAQ